MKKLILSLVLVISLVVAMNATAFADIIVTPSDNFFEKHANECEYVDRYYFAAGATDFAKVYKSPEDGTVIGEVENGQLIYVTWKWNGWLFAGNDGWLHSDDVSIKYDNTSFMEDHKTTEYAGEEFSATTVQLYTYPNSGESVELVENAGYATFADSFTIMYVDDAGLKWGYLPYYMISKGWVCLDDPTNTSLNSGQAAPEKSIAQINGADAQVEPPKNYLPLATGVVVVVVVITLVFLVRKKKK